MTCQIYTCCFLTQHLALLGKGLQWLPQCQDKVTVWDACVHGACFLVSQWGSTTKLPWVCTITSQYQPWYDLRCCKDVNNNNNKQKHSAMRFLLVFFPSGEKHWYLSLLRLALGITSIRQGLVTSVSAKEMWLSGILGHGAGSLVFQWGSTIESPPTYFVTSWYTSWYDLRCC